MDEMYFGISYIQRKMDSNDNFQFIGAYINLLIDLIAGYAIISLRQHFGNRKSVSQNKLCN